MQSAMTQCAVMKSTHRVPEEALPHAMPLAGGARELKGGMHYIRLQAHGISHALHKEGVPTAECGHRQDAYRQLPIIPPAPQGQAVCSLLLNAGRAPFPV